ncbi:MAG: RlmE family RNA methyltransferase [Alphaproteobacteria bacterium]|nr:RlmE family RNA methyltransferase [Alphaproteobacteria bacterium]OJV15299.1 MAG: hypothetical protein BGO27_02190 [Alphaproteobacteria bacterium 33-17]
MKQFKRTERIKVKTAKGRKLSSKLWLERQLNDPFVKLSKEKGYRSRAAFKLLEIDEKYKILKPGISIIDIGAAPGSWLQVILEKCNSAKKQSTVIGLDLQEIEPIEGVELIHGDFTEQKTVDELNTILAGKKLDVVLSDMAASSTGFSDVDHDRIVMLCELVYEFAIENLKVGGSVVVKVLRGGTEHKLLADFKRNFKEVKHFKPQSSRQDSAEMYLIAKGFNG